VLQELYKELYVAGNNLALRKLHTVLGYYRGHEGKSSKDLITAIKAGDSNLVTSLISKGHYIYQDVISKLDTFHNEEDLKLLHFIFFNTLNHPNYNINANNHGNTPLHHAAWSGNLKATTDLLNRKDVDINVTNKLGETPLHKVVLHENTEVLEKLIAAGANVNALDNSGSTPLHNAASSQNARAVRILIEADANVNALDNSGSTPLHNALYRITIDSSTIRILVRTENINLNIRDKDGNTPLHHAAWSGNLKATTDLLNRKDVDINVTNKLGETPLHKVVLHENTEVLEKLIAAGANVNALDNSGSTPLHNAASSQNARAVRILIEADANVNALDNSGSTPLHNALYRITIDSSTIRILVRTENINLNIRDKDGYTPLHLAVLATNYMSHNILGLDALCDVTKDIYLLKDNRGKNQIDLANDEKTKKSITRYFTYKQKKFAKLLDQFPEYSLDEDEFVKVSPKSQNIKDILKIFKNAPEGEGSPYFDLILNSGRLDVVEALIDNKAFNEEEVFNIALRFKMDDLRSGETEPTNTKLFKKSIEQLSPDRIPELYAAVVDALFIDRKNKVLLPTTEVLQELYKELSIPERFLALRKLHNFLGYFRFHEGQNSPELVALLTNEQYNKRNKNINPIMDQITEDDRNKALDLISKGHYIYDFSKFSSWDDFPLVQFMFAQTEHPNYNTNSKTDDGRTPLTFAMFFKDFSTFAKLVKLPEIDINAYIIRDTPLTFAVRNGQTQIAIDLLDRGVDPNKRDANDHRSPLQLAAVRGHLDLVKLLLDKGADIRQAHEALHEAAYQGHTEVMRELLSRGADVNAKNGTRTLLDSAALYSGRVDPEMKALIEEHMAAKPDPEMERSRKRALALKAAEARRALAAASSVGVSSSSSSSTSIPPAAPAAQVDTSAVKSQRTRGSDSQEPNASKRRR
jgi:ankyrin repeat protein